MSSVCPVVFLKKKRFGEDPAQPQRLGRVTGLIRQVPVRRHRDSKIKYGGNGKLLGGRRGSSPMAKFQRGQRGAQGLKGFEVLQAAVRVKVALSSIWNALR